MKKNLFIKILVFLIVAITSFGIIINIFHFLDIRKTEIIDFNKVSHLNTFKQNLKAIKTSLDSININSYTGQISKKDLTAFNNNLKNCLSKLETATILDYKGKMKINIKDKNKLFSDVANKCITPLRENSIIMDKYDTNIKGFKELLDTQLYTGMINIDIIQEQFRLNYEYHVGEYLTGYPLLSRILEINLLANYYNLYSRQLQFETNWFLSQLGGNLNE